MSTAKAIDIEVTRKNAGRETWYNLFVGTRFKAIPSVHYKGHYELTKEGLEELSKKLDKTISKAVISEVCATPVGDKAKEVFLNTFMIFPKAVKYIRHVRLFRATKDYHMYDRGGENIIGTFFREGDIFEEVFDKPNKIVKVQGAVRDDLEGSEYELKYINESDFLLGMFEELEEIPVKEGTLFTRRREALAKSYKNTMTSIAKAQRKAEELRFLLDIEDDNDLANF